MATLCSPGCDEQEIRSYCTPCVRQNALRKGGFSRLGFLDCDVEIDDITDEAEWAAIVAANKLVFLPEMIGTTVDDEVTTLQISACRGVEETDRISGIDWQLRLFDNDTLTDFDLEYDLKNKVASKTAIFMDCNGLLYYRYDWEEGENPGFGQLTSSVNRASAVGEVQVLNINLRFNTFQSGFKAIKLTQSLESVLLSACEQYS